MRTPYRQHSQILGPVLAGVLLFVGVSGCSTATPEEDWQAMANGVDADIGGVEVRSLLLVAENANESGRFLGMLLNTSEQPVELVFSDEDDRAAVRVEPQGEPHQPPTSRNR
ncbi:hypothetical protein M1E17_18435 [Arthrobacter sp. D1-29]